MSGQSVRGIQESVAVGMIQVLFVILYTVTFTKEKKKSVSAEREFGDVGFQMGMALFPLMYRRRRRLLCLITHNSLSLIINADVPLFFFLLI